MRGIQVRGEDEAMEVDEAAVDDGGGQDAGTDEQNEQLPENMELDGEEVSECF